MHEINPKEGETLHFEGIQYCPATRTLIDNAGNTVHLRPQSADVLALLAQHVGELVSREKIINTVWPEVVTTDDSLVQCIADIRRVLGKQAIATIPKKGYLLQPREPTSDNALSNQEDAIKPTGRGHSFRKWAVILSGVLLVTAVLGSWVLRGTGVTGDETIFPALQPQRSLAVLPFFNLGDDVSIEYFSNGLGEDLTTDLSKLPGLTVIAYASSKTYPDADSGFKQIAQELGVRYLVRGTVRRDSTRIRINVSLIDPFSSTNLWSERYDRTLKDPFDVQTNVARQVVQALALEMSIDAIQQPRVEPDAYHMLLQGLKPLHDLTDSGNLVARGFFKKAVELDPEYARAHASIAMTYARTKLIGLPTNESPKSVAIGLKSAVRAIQLDPNLPHAYYALGLLNLSLGKFDHALSATRHALQLDSNYSDGYALLAQISVLSGDLEEAHKAISRAEILHPKHPASFSWIKGQILFHLGNYSDAQQAFEHAVSSTPRYYNGLILAAANAAHLGQPEIGRALLERAKVANPMHNPVYAAQAIPYRVKDRSDELAAGLRLLKREP